MRWRHTRVAGRSASMRPRSRGGRSRPASTRSPTAPRPARTPRAPALRPPSRAFVAFVFRTLKRSVRLELVVGAERLADSLGQRFRGQAGLVALAAQLLDRHVARGVDLGARDDPGRAVLVPDPDVLHL